MKQGELARAKDKLDRALKEDPNSPDVHSVRALLFERMGDTGQADAEFRAALRLAPHDPQIVNNYADVPVPERPHRRGREALPGGGAQRALPDARGSAYTNAGVCLRTAKRDEEARVNFTRALQIQPNYAEAAFQLATLQFQHGELAPARACIDTFIGSFPTPRPTCCCSGCAWRGRRATGSPRSAMHASCNLIFPEPTRRAPWPSSITIRADADDG